MMQLAYDKNENGQAEISRCFHSPAAGAHDVHRRVSHQLTNASLLSP